jgi:hypothetical protein
MSESSPQREHPPGMKRLHLSGRYRKRVMQEKQIDVVDIESP